MKLPPLLAAAVAAGIIAGGSVLAFSYIPDLLIWAAFVGWASYDQSGANAQAAVRSSAAMVFGVIMACAVILAAESHMLPLGLPLATAVSAAIASFLIVVASRVHILSIVPATFYGFASTFAYSGIAPGAFTTSAIARLDGHSPLLIVPLSLLIGTGLGVLHGWLTGVLAMAAVSAGAKPPAVRLNGSITR